MRLKLFLLCLFALVWLIPVKLVADKEGRYSLSGYIKDAANRALNVVKGFGAPGPASLPIFLLSPNWKDPAGIGNYYRFKIVQNGKVIHESFTIKNDQPFDGKEVNLALTDYPFQIGDTGVFWDLLFRCLGYYHCSRQIG